MNKTVAYVGIIAFAIVGLGALTYITLERPDASATFTSTLVTLIGLVVTAAVSVNGLAKANEQLGQTNERLEQVEKNTNGRLHAKDAEIVELQRRMLDAGLDPQTGNPITGAISVDGTV